MSTSRTESSYHHGSLRETLVEAALVQLGTREAAEIGLRDLARQIGVSPAAPYRHFEDRQALLEAVAAEGFRRFGAALKAAAGTVPAADELEAMARAYVGFATGAPRLFRLMFSAAIEHRRNPELAAAARASYASLAVAAARENAGDAAEVAVTVWAFVHGLSVLLIDEQILGAGDADALVQRLSRRFVAGLRAAAGQ